MSGLALATALLGGVSAAAADSLTTTYASNNSQSGNMFDVSATGSAGVTITGFSQNFVSATTIPSFSVYEYLGSVVGHTSSTGWVLVDQTGSFTSNAQGTATVLPLLTPLSLHIAAGQTVGLYLVSGGGSNVAYTDGTAVGAVAASNANLTIYQGYGIAGSFGATFSPRIWNGTIDYSLSYPYVDYATTTNQTAVATALTQAAATAGANALLTAINAAPSSSLPGIYDQLSGSGLAGAQNLAFEAGYLFSAAIADRGRVWVDGGLADGAPTTGAPAAALGYAEAPTGPIQVKGAPSNLNPPPPPSLRVWFAALGGGQTMHGDASVGSYGLSDSLAGGVLGLDYQISPNFLVGAAGGFSNGAFGVSALSTSGTAAGGHFGLYGLATNGAVYAQASANVSAFDNSTTRNVPAFGGLPASTYTGSFLSREFRARLEVGRRVQLADFTVTPFMAVEGAALWSNGFTENGGGIANLAVQGDRASSAPASIGARVQRVAQLANGMTLTPTFTAAYVHEFSPERPISASLVNLPGAAFTVDGAPSGRNAAQLKGGLQLSLNASATLFADFEGEFSDRGQSYAGKGGLKIGW